MPGWIKCICVVEFDRLRKCFQAIVNSVKRNEIACRLGYCDGPILTHRISCFSSFPDTNSLIPGDYVYTYTYEDPERGTGAGNRYFGSSFFRLQKDETAERGYLAKSVVVISRLGFFSLMEQVVSVIAKLYFSHGSLAVDAANGNVASWPTPAIGKSFELPLLGRVFHVSIPARIPTSTEFNLNSIVPRRKNANHEFSDILFLQCTGQFLESPLVDLFSRFLPNLWKLWEAMITSRSILVLSSTPQTCTHSVLSLVSLISPLIYGGHFYPYFTIHDPAFKYFSSSEQIQAVIGTTNPYFLKAMNMDVVLLMEDFEEEEGKKDRFQAQGKFFMKADKELSSAELSDYWLRRHFLKLTEQFISPLDKYYRTLIPHPAEIIPFEDIPAVGIFKAEEFLSRLKQKGRGKKDVNSENGLGSGRSVLYKYDELNVLEVTDSGMPCRSFLNSPNFVKWHESRLEQAEHEVRKIYMRKTAEFDVKLELTGKGSTEKIDVYVRILEEIGRFQKQSMDSPKGYKDILRRKLEDVIDIVPEDIGISLRRTFTG